jgi:translation initiation factor 5B
LKKEGKLLTKKQKEEQKMAELRKQALLASGVQIEGLQASGSAPPAAKKVVYGNRKKKGPATKEPSSKDASPAPESRPRSPEPSPSPSPAPASKPEDDAKSDWEASSDDEPEAKAAVKDSWDASSEEEQPEPTPASTKDGKGAPKGE